MDELEDITFSQSMQIILDALLDTVMEFFHITEAQLEEFTSSFIGHLPKYMQDALSGGEYESFSVNSYQAVGLLW